MTNSFKRAALHNTQFHKHPQIIYCGFWWISIATISYTNQLKKYMNKNLKQIIIKIYNLALTSKIKTKMSVQELIW